MERGHIPAGGGHSLPALSCTSRGGPPLLDGYLLRVQGLDGASGSKGPQPMQSFLHVSISEAFSLSSFLHSCHHLPYLFILPT